jgi:hypothetical protein
VKKEKGKEKGSDSEEKVEDVKEEIIEDRPTSAKATARHSKKMRQIDGPSLKWQHLQ